MSMFRNKHFHIGVIVIELTPILPVYGTAGVLCLYGYHASIEKA